MAPPASDLRSLDRRAHTILTGCRSPDRRSTLCSEDEARLSEQRAVVERLLGGDDETLPGAALREKMSSIFCVGTPLGYERIRVPLRDGEGT